MRSEPSAPAPTPQARHTYTAPQGMGAPVEGVVVLPSATPVAPPTEPWVVRVVQKIAPSEQYTAFSDFAMASAWAAEQRAVETCLAVSVAPLERLAPGGTDGEASQDVPQVADATEEELALLRESLQDFPSVARAAGAGAPDDEALPEALRAMAPHVGPPNQAWNASQTCYRAADRLAALNATVTRRDTSIAAFKSDLAAVRAERDEALAGQERAWRWFKTDAAALIAQRDEARATIATLRAAIDDALRAGHRSAQDILRSALGSSTGGETP